MMELLFICVLEIPTSLAQKLFFEDNFNGGQVDESNWKFDQTLSGGGDWQFQWFVKDDKNAFIRDGILHIKPTLTADSIGIEQLYKKQVDIDSADCTSSINYGCSRKGTREHIINPVRSASLKTTKAFKYGTVEIRAKLPAGDWLRPYIKLLPKEDSYGPWPASGEIDMLECRGNKELYNEEIDQVGVNQISSTLHFGPSYDANGWKNTHHIMTSETGFNEEFHIYKLDWNEKGIKFFVDNKLIGNTDIEAEESFWHLGEFEQNHKDKVNPWNRGSAMAPFDKEFFIYIGLAVGGVSDYFSDDFENRPYPKPRKNDSPKAPLSFWKAKTKWYPTWTTTEDSADFQIDYVKVFSK
jgi:beta-glucanase (GH16 family)